MDDSIEVRVITYIKHRNRFIKRLKSFLQSHNIIKAKAKYGYSKGENIIWNWLKKNVVKFEFQKRFPDCKDKHTLPFDFYLPAYNLCIEYQGSQHYDPGFYIRKKKSFEDGMLKFNIQKKHDEMKRQYCTDKQIYFLEIKYTENIEAKLKEVLL